MRLVALFFSTVLFVAVSFMTAGTARAQLLFCNQSLTDSRVTEGHDTLGPDGFAVHGTFVVRTGTCKVIVPGELQARRYFVRVQSNGETYGDPANRLCVYDAGHFRITNEDAKDFDCKGAGSSNDVHTPGNGPMRVAEFMVVDTGGQPTLVFTQRRNYSFHFLLK